MQSPAPDDPSSSDGATVDERVRQACAAGAHEAAATLIIERHGREVLGFLLGRVRDAELASEIFSAFTEDLWRGLPAFEFRCSVRTWAYTLARHAASRQLDELRRRRRRHVPLSEANELSRMEHKVRTATLAEFRTEVRDRIAALRERLPEEDQSLLVLRVNRRLEWIEIAHVLSYQGAPLDEAVLKREAARLRKRFQLVKERLRRMADEEGLAGERSGE